MEEKKRSLDLSSDSERGNVLAEIVDAKTEPARGEWSNHCEFFLSSLGLAVGLGNLWRFPYVCYDNGGGTFLIPYILMLFFVGLPMFFLEMVLGQYAGLSCTKIYARLAPGLKGMGYGMITIPTIINFQYVVIMAYAMFYLFAGFTSNLPWGTCKHDYNSVRCYSLVDAENCDPGFETFYMRECVNATFFCSEFGHYFDESKNGTCQRTNVPINSTDMEIPFADVTYRVSASEDYWYRRVLNFEVENGHVNTTVNSWSKWGGMRWELVGCLALSWALICLSLIQGVQSYGKVVYFTTLFPYVVITILLGYVATLDGFDRGIDYYLVPRNLSRLGEVDIWNEAAGQIFYSLGVGVGSQLLLSSYNDFRANAFRDALLIGFGNSLTSLYAGFVVFGVLGYLSKQKNMPMDDVIESGPGLAFVVYPEAVSIMSASPPFFSFLFFFMLNLLAISSVCGSWEALIASIFDELPKLRKYRWQAMVISCSIAFLCGLSMCFDSGFLMFDIMNDRCSNAILLMSFIELVTVSWFYGSDKIMQHITDMEIKIPKVLKFYWWICWVLITPLIIGSVTIIAWINAPVDEFLDYEFPPAVQAMGWGMELCGLIILVAISGYSVIKGALNGKPWAYIKPGPMMQPNHKWGPRPDSGLIKRATDNEAFDKD